jgi:hypothetical protein
MIAGSNVTRVEQLELDVILSVGGIACISELTLVSELRLTKRVAYENQREQSGCGQRAPT